MQGAFPGEEKVILTALCGHGFLDLAAYANFQSGEMRDYGLADEAVQAALGKHCPRRCDCPVQLLGLGRQITVARRR